MRRLIAYITMAFAIILCVGVSFNTVFSKMTPGREFTNGRELIYTISQKEGGKAIEDGNKAVNDVANEMRSRLDKMYVEDYSVKIEGNDTISVTIANNDDSEFNNIARYLNFSGGDFSLSGKNEETRKLHEDVFKDSVAYIEKVQDVVPVIVFPVSNPESVKNLIEAVSGSSEEGGEQVASAPVIHKAAVADGEDGEEKKEEPNIFLWANWQDGDSYESAEKDPAVTGEKILLSFISDHIWHEEAKEEDKETKLQFICATSDADGNLDTSKLKQANQQANYICNMFNATSYDYEVKNALASFTSSGLVINSIPVTAKSIGGENLLVFGSTVNVAMSATLIATLIAIVIVSLLLVVFYRLSSIAAITNVLTTTYLTFVVFMSMNAVFNIAAIVGGIILACASTAVTVHYLHKFKEEVLKGRSLKKANQEASKKSTLFTIDISVVTAFAGLMIYALGGTSLKPMGIILFFGALFTLAMTLIIFKFMMYLVTNATSLSNRLNLFNIEAKDAKDVMSDEEKKDDNSVNYTKGKKVVGVLAGLLTVASIAGIIVFGVTKGSPLNVENATKNTTTIYTVVEGEKRVVTNEEDFKKIILPRIIVDDKELSYQSDNGVSCVEKVEYNYETKLETTYHVFVTKLNYEFNSSKIAYKDVGGQLIPVETLDEAFDGAVMAIEGEASELYSVSNAKTVSETVSTPNQGLVALATGIAIVGASFYVALRYRPSRGVSLLLVSGSATVAAYGIFVLTRIGTSAVTSIAMPVVALVSICASMIYFHKEKELVKEEKIKPSLLRRSEIMVTSISNAGVPILYFIIIATYLAINYFGFGLNNYALVFASSLIGIILAVIYTLCILGPLGNVFEKLFSKIKLPKFNHPERKSKIKLQSKPNSSEPQETIFIGIND